MAQRYVNGCQQKVIENQNKPTDGMNYVAFVD